jgi:hypothetical protein
VTLRPWEESRAAPIVRGVAWVVLVLRVADGGASGDDVLPTFSTVPVLPVIVGEPSTGSFRAREPPVSPNTPGPVLPRDRTDLEIAVSHALIEARTGRAQRGGDLGAVDLQRSP